MASGAGTHWQARSFPRARSRSLPRRQRWSPVLDPGCIYRRRPLPLCRTGGSRRELHPQFRQGGDRCLQRRRRVLCDRSCGSDRPLVPGCLSGTLSRPRCHAGGPVSPSSLPPALVRDSGETIREVPHDGAAGFLQRRRSVDGAAGEVWRRGHSHGAVLRPASPAGRGAPRVHAHDADDAGQSRQSDRVDGGTLGCTSLRRPARFQAAQGAADPRPPPGRGE